MVSTTMKHSIALFWLLCIASIHAAAPPASVLTTKIQVLLTLPFDVKPRHTLMSADAQHVAYVGWKGVRQQVVLDGTSVGPLMDKIPESTLKFSPDGKHLAYAGFITNKTLAVLDGKVLAVPATIGQNSLVFSPDSQRFAFEEIMPDGRRVVLDGTPHRTFPKIHGAVMFSPDSHHFAYCVSDATNFYVVRDHILSKPWDAVSDILFTFSPDSQRFGYFALRNQKMFFVIDEKISRPYEKLSQLPVVFSADSKRFAYVSYGAKAVIMLDGKEQESNEGVGGMIFSPDRKELIYLAKRGSKHFIVGKGGKAIELSGSLSGDEQLRSDSFAFSPDGQQLAFSAQHGSQWMIFRNGRAEAEADAVSNKTPLFTASGKLVYVLIKTNRYQLWIDGKSFGPYKQISPPVLSADGEHVGCLAEGDEGFVVLIDGLESEKFSNVPRSFTLVPFGRSGFRTIALRGNDILKVTVELPAN
jgi:hypothetical protein